MLGRVMSVLMELNKIIIRESVDSQIIVLREVRGERRFPIVIGSEVAAAIDRRLKGLAGSRPMTRWCWHRWTRLPRSRCSTTG